MYLHDLVATGVDDLHGHALVLASREGERHRARQGLEAVGIDHAAQGVAQLQKPAQPSS
jgi:hypothetical protein